jgi:outer membrane receptor protein involved in Fe transport
LLLGGAWRRHGSLRLGGGDVAPLSDFTQWGWHARAALALTARWRLQATVLANGLPSAGRTDELGRGTVRNYANRDVFAWVEALFAGRGLLREARVAALVHQQHEVGDAVRCTLSGGQVPDLSGCAQTAGQVARGTVVGLPDGVTRHDRTQDEVWVVGVLATTRMALVPGRIDAVVGVEATQEAVDSSAQQRTGAKPAWKSLARGNFSDGSRYAQTAAYAHIQATPWTGKRWRWLGTVGGRGGWVAASAPSVPGVGDVQFTLPVAAASIGTTLELDRRHAVFVHASNGLRAPNLQETTLLGSTGDQFEVPNAGLKAESIQQLEVGVRSQSRWLTGQVVGYVSQLEDFIDRRKLSTADVQKLGLTTADLNCTALGDAKCVPVYQRQNVGRGSIQGAELALSGPTWQGARPWLTASLLRGTTISAGKEEPLRRAPPAQLAAGIHWQSPSKRWSVAPWWRGASAQSRLAAGDRSDLRICEDPAAPGRTLPGQTCTGTPGWQTWNLRLGGQWPIARGAVSALRLDLDLTNLTDARYRVHGSGLDAPGRGVRLVLGAVW